MMEIPEEENVVVGNTTAFQTQRNTTTNDGNTREG
jgi:hypothetical protein